MVEPTVTKDEDFFGNSDAPHKSTVPPAFSSMQTTEFNELQIKNREKFHEAIDRQNTDIFFEKDAVEVANLTRADAISKAWKATNAIPDPVSEISSDKPVPPPVAKSSAMEKIGEMMRFKQALQRLEQGSDEEVEEEKFSAPGLRDSAMFDSLAKEEEEKWVKPEEVEY